MTKILISNFIFYLLIISTTVCFVRELALYLYAFFYLIFFPITLYSDFQDYKNNYQGLETKMKIFNFIVNSPILLAIFIMWMTTTLFINVLYFLNYELSGYMSIIKILLYSFIVGTSTYIFQIIRMRNK